MKPEERPFGAPDPATLAYDDRGLLPVIAQDESSGAVLMLAWADRETATVRFPAERLVRSAIDSCSSKPEDREAS